jgi:hypothetical protein
MERGAASRCSTEATSPLKELIDIFATVYEHHGEYSHEPPLDEVEVLGAPQRRTYLPR